MTRTINSLRNVKFTLVGQFFGVGISFFSRMVFVRYLGVEYLGLNGLFTNIISILSLAELGIGSAIVFSIYEPLANRDERKLKALMFIYKRSYMTIGIWMFVAGLAITPFLGYIIKDIPDIPYIQLIYLIFISNSAMTYFFSYKRALIIADQKKYIDSIYHYSAMIVLNVGQILILIVSQNYFLYLGFNFIVIFAENYMISRKADRLYPFLKNYDGEKLETKEKITIIKNIKAMFFHRVGSMVVLGTDNLILSMYVGIAAVGLYSNYLLIIGAVTMVSVVFFQSVSAGVGNLGATESKIHTERIFNYVDFIGYWFYGFSSIALFNLLNPFISLWIGKTYLFEMPVVFLIVINYYIQGQRASVLTFRDALGLFWYDRYKPLFESIINLVASIYLAINLGVAGVLLGTIISSLTTVFWVEPYILYKYGFNSQLRRYFINYVKRVVLTFAMGGICWYLGSFITASLLLEFLIRTLICAVVPNSIIILVFYRTAELQYLLSVLKQFLSGRTT